MGTRQHFTERKNTWEDGTGKQDPGVSGESGGKGFLSAGREVRGGGKKI